MTECRRCPDLIVNAANQLMGLYEPDKLVPGSNQQENTHVVVWKSYQAEARGLAKAIGENIRANPQDTHLAMVTRRRFGFRLRDEMLALDNELNVELNFSESPLETWPVREAFLFFCLIADPDAATWRAWLAYMNSSDGSKYKAPKRNAPAYLKFLTKCEDVITESAIEQLANCSKQPPGGGGKNLLARAKRFVERKKNLRWDRNHAVTFIEEVFNAKSWGIDQMADPETMRLATYDIEMARVRASDICQELQLMNPESTTEQCLKEVARRLRYEIATREPMAIGGTTDLSISTLWGAKGITADHVYVIGLCGEAIPGKMRDDYPGTLNEFVEEQRRLFYVSITRSKKTLVLSRARYIRRGDALKLGLSPPRGTTLSMCPFLQDIRNFLPDAQNGEDWQGVVAPSI